MDEYGGYLEQLCVDSLTNSSTRFASGVWRILAVRYSNMMEWNKEDELRGSEKAYVRWGKKNIRRSCFMRNAPICGLESSLSLKHREVLSYVLRVRLAQDHCQAGASYLGPSY